MAVDDAVRGEFFTKDTDADRVIDQMEDMMARRVLESQGQEGDGAEERNGGPWRALDGAGVDELSAQGGKRP